MKAVIGDQDNIAANLGAYLHGFSPNVKDILSVQPQRSDRQARKSRSPLPRYRKVQQDRSPPDTVSNADIEAIFEELIRKFAELSNRTAGEHFTPREVIRLMVNLIFAEDDDALSKPGVVRSRNRSDLQIVKTLSPQKRRELFDESSERRTVCCGLCASRRYVRSVLLWIWRATFPRSPPGRAAFPLRRLCGASFPRLASLIFLPRAALLSPPLASFSASCQPARHSRLPAPRQLHKRQPPRPPARRHLPHYP